MVPPSDSRRPALAAGNHFELVFLHLKKGQCIIRGEHRNREGQSGDNEGAHRDGEARVKPVRDTAA